MNRPEKPLRRAKRLLNPVALTAIAAALTGCVVVEPPPGTNTPPALTATTVPAGFTFAATHPVDVVVRADPTILKEGQVGGIEVARPDGKIIYRGPLRSDAPAELALTVALKDTKLGLTLRVGQIEKHASVAIADKAASYTFQ